MDRLKKLLCKISSRDRERLLTVLNMLVQDRLAGLQIIKLQGSDYYRLRCGRFRIIFHRDHKTRVLIVDSVKVRNERTYKHI